MPVIKGKISEEVSQVIQAFRIVFFQDQNNGVGPGHGIALNKSRGMDCQFEWLDG